MMLNDKRRCAPMSLLLLVALFVSSDLAMAQQQEGVSLVVAEIVDMKVTVKKEEIGESRSGTILLNVTEVIEGSLKPGEVLIQYTRTPPRTGGYPQAWYWVEPRIGMKLLLEIQKDKADLESRSAKSAIPIDKLPEGVLDAKRKIASLRAIRDPAERLRAIDAVAFRSEHPVVQTFIMEQVAAVFRDTGYDYWVRLKAASQLRWLSISPPVYGTVDEEIAISAWVQGLQDPTVGIRDMSLQCLSGKAAGEMLGGSVFRINAKVVLAINDLVKTEKDERLRQKAVKIQDDILSILAKINALADQLQKDPK